MTDQELIFSALRQVGLIVTEHLASGTRDADNTINQLIAVLDTPELAEAIRARVRAALGEVILLRAGKKCGVAIDDACYHSTATRSRFGGRHGHTAAKNRKPAGNSHRAATDH